MYSLLEIETITPKSKDKEISNMSHRPMDYGMKSLLYIYSWAAMGQAIPPFIIVLRENEISQMGITVSV